MELFKKKTDPKNPIPAVSDMPTLENDEEEDEILLRRKPNTAAIVTGLSVLALVVMILSALPSGGEKGTAVNSKVLTDSPKMESISSVITGAGTLAPGNTDKVELPKVVELQKYYVHNGDKVLKDQVLASVDSVEVAAAIGKLQDVMNTLDKDINTESSKKDANSIKSGVSGRVKAIFAEPGVEVSQTVYDHGCLMLISLDGLMQVTFEPQIDTQVGQTVNVELTDGTVQTGKVYAVTDGKATVTLSDLTAEYGSPAVVKAEDGQVLGSGDLDIHSPLQVSGYYGTVASVSVKVNQKVGSGTTLLNLKEVGHTSEYTALLKRRSELSEQMDALYAMSDGYIRAQKDGIVADIPDDAEYANDEELAEVAPMAFIDDYSNVKLDWLTGIGEAKISLLADGPSGGGTSFLSTVKGFVIGASGDIHIIPTSDAALDGITPYKEATLKTKDQFPIDMILALPQFEKYASIVSNLPALSISVDKVYTFGVMENPFATSASDKWIIFTATETASSGGAGGLGGLGGIDISSLLGGMRSFGSYGSASSAAKVYDTYSTDTETILSLVPLDELTVTINVDELDILQLEEGMDAEITMDAFKSTTFPGTITRVGAFGANEGGNTKYQVEVTLHTTEQMLVGMNAAVRVVTGSSEEVLTIPAAAIVEENGKTWVYTAYDKSKDVLTGQIEIQTGISDGELVQVLNGLDDNSVFFYRYADSIVYGFL